MPQTLTPEQIAAVGDPIVAGLLPGWKATWVACSQEQIDRVDPKLPGPNLAVCQSQPTRRLTTVYVVSPWPDNEDLRTTLHHELGHAWISPVTAQIPDTAASVMLEEQLIETLGIYLAGLAAPARAAARRALASIVDELVPARMRARVSARITRARTGAAMDPETIQKMIDALKAGDGESALKMCEEALVKAASGGAAPSVDAPPDSIPDPGAPPMDAKIKPPAGPSPSPATPPDPAAARASARLAEIDGHSARARRAADAAAGTAVRARLREIRQDGVKLPTNLEAELGKMVDVDAFERRIGDLLAGLALAQPGGARARAQVEGGPVQHSGAPPPSDTPAPPVDAVTLRAEGATEQFIANYQAQAKDNPHVAAALLAGFRDPTAVRARQRNGFGSKPKAVS